MKSNIKNSTKKLLLLVAATVTAASAVAIATGSSYSAYAETDPERDPVETSAVFENEQYTGTYTRRAEYRINDSGPLDQKRDVFSWLGFPSWENMAASGYKQVTVTIKLVMKEKYKGYQQVFLYPNEDKVYSSSAPRIEVEYGGNNLNKNYGNVYFNFKTLPISDFIKNNSLGLVVRYGATGGGEDDWYNKDMFMTVTVSKNIVREYSYAYGDNIN